MSSNTKNHGISFREMVGNPELGRDCVKTSDSTSTGPLKYFPHWPVFAFILELCYKRLVITFAQGYMETF